MTDTLSCWNCGTALTQVLVPVSRHEFCPQCAEAVHCCRMCIHFSPDAVDQCREDRADPPTLKESANFCDFFSPRFGSEESGRSKQDETRAKLDALFGGGSEGQGD